MSAEQVALIPQCAECGEVWLPADEGVISPLQAIDTLPVRVREAEQRREEHAVRIRSLRLLNEALPMYRDLGDEPGVSQCLWSLGQCYYQQGQVDAARDSIDQAIALFRRLGNQFGLGWGLFTRAILALQLHDTPLARTTSVEALKIFANADDVTGKVLVLDCIAEVARREDDRLRAARLAGEFPGHPATTAGGTDSSTTCAITSSASEPNTRAAQRSARNDAAEKSMPIRTRSQMFTR